MLPVELTPAILVRLALALDPRHRAEILRRFTSLTAWVRSRLALPGIAWALVRDGKPVFALGVVSHGCAGWLWLAGARGWERHVKHVGKLWRAIATAGAYECFICDVCDDNLPAQRFAERGGFREIERRHGVIYYGSAP